MTLSIAAAAQHTTLWARKGAAGPALDGKMEPARAQAQPLAVKLNDGRSLPGDATRASLLSLYDVEKVYVLAR